METSTFNTPALFGDHHVTEVRRILLSLSGVAEVYASSAFQTVEVTFDPKQTSTDKIAAQLEEAGYLGELPIMAETGTEEREGLFRHTVLYETVKKSVGFAQKVEPGRRPLWPCTGMGNISVCRDKEAYHA